MNDAEERISDLEERKMEIILSKQPTAKKKKQASNMRPMEQYKECQSTHNRDSKRRRKRKED